MGGGGDHHSNTEPPSNLMEELMLATDAHHAHPDFKTMLSKVPEITLFSWITKMLAAILAVVVCRSKTKRGQLLVA